MQGVSRALFVTMVYRLNLGDHPREGNQPKMTNEQPKTLLELRDDARHKADLATQAQLSYVEAIRAAINDRGATVVAGELGVSRQRIHQLAKSR